MPIPDFQSLMLPLLQLAADGEEHAIAETRQPLAEQFSLSEVERKEPLGSGTPRFNNRVAWAKIYLERAGLLDKTRRGYFKITQRGQRLVQNPPQHIDLAFLKQFPEFTEFLRKRVAPAKADETVDNQTPEEALEAAYEKIREDLAAELLEQVKSASPEFFERLVLDLILKMGYGGSGENTASLTAPGADGGVDGIVNEDRLGLDVIYLQAKRWENTVGRPELQKFVGALHGKRAKKGVFLTTSAFSQDATDYVATIDPKVVLIDGTRLAHLMIDFDVGVSRSHTYEIKRIDSDYFAEE